MNILEHLISSSSINKNFVYTSDIVFYKKRFYDDNIFFTALIAFTLKDIYNTFNTKELLNVDVILKNSLHAFSFYQNKHGGLSYNFYPTTPLNQYSGIKFLNKFTALHIPDDLDSTSLIYLAKENTRKSTLQKIKKEFEKLSYDNKPLKSIPKSFKNTKAYRTWFATKMNHDMDICVMCNVLCLTYSKKLNFSKVDNDSIQFISLLIEKNKLLKQAYLFSPHYKNHAIVLYHVARLYSYSNHIDITKHQKKLIEYTLELLKKVKHPLEKIILYTTLYKLGHTAKFNIQLTNKSFKNFYWFKANPFSIAAPWIKKILSKNKFLHLEYQCDAYCWVLILELKQLSQASLKIKNSDIKIYN